MDRKIAVTIPEWAFKHWWHIAYLIPPQGGWFREQLEMVPTDAFHKEVNRLLRAVLAGKEVPEAIAPTIFNLADDLLAGRDLTIRTGDYIAIQNHLRNI